MMVVKPVDHDGRKRRSNNFRTWRQQHCMIAWTYSFLHLTSVVMWPRTCQLVISSSDTNGWQNWSISRLVVNCRQEEPDFATYYLPFPTFFAAPKNSKIVTNYIVLEQKRRKISDLEHIFCCLSQTSFWKILICAKQGHPSCFVHKRGIDLHNFRLQKCI